MATPYIVKSIAALLALTVLAIGGYLVAAESYPCELPAFTVRHARKQAGHFMRSQSARMLELVSGLQGMGAGPKIIDALRDDCRNCILTTESIGPLQSIWAASLIFPSDGRTMHVVVHVASCRAMIIERSLLEG
jgi:hypothetical protein